MTTPITRQPFLTEARARLGDVHSLWPYTPKAFETPHGWMHYVDEGPATTSAASQPETIVCVHGNPTWSFMWRHVIARYAPNQRIIAVDHLGCGLSQRSNTFPARLSDHAENLAALVRHLNLERITLVVHDWGGAIGLAAARRDPARYAKLVLTNTGAFPTRDMPWRIALCRAKWGLGPFLVERCNAFAGLLPWLGVADPRHMSPEVRAAYLMPTRDMAGRRAVRAFVEDIPMHAAHPTMPELRAVEQSLSYWRDKPVALAWGEQDWCFTPRFRQRFERELPQAFVVQGLHVGHLIPEEAPNLVHAAIDHVLGGREVATHEV